MEKGTINVMLPAGIVRGISGGLVDVPIYILADQVIWMVITEHPETGLVTEGAATRRVHTENTFPC